MFSQNDYGGFPELKATFSLKLALKVEHSSARPMDLTTFREYRL